MNASADVAVRDKKYLESFLAGYTNPIVSESFNYPNPQKYTDTPAFDVNGIPITFPEKRVMYSVSTMGTLSTTATLVWVFKNGLLLDESTYTILNTAYGIKCFMKASEVVANDDIDVVINRIYNPHNEKSRQIVKVPAATTMAAYIFPTNNFGVFYHMDYLRVYVKRGVKYLLIPLECILKELDVTGTNVKINIIDFQLLSGDSIEVYNSIYFFKHIENRVTSISQPWKRDFILSETFDGDDLRLIPTGSSHDFDIFLDGYQLIPEVHFGLIDNSSRPTGFPILRFYFDIPNNTRFNLRIYKNESVLRNKLNRTFIETLDDKGLVVREQLTEHIPYMTNLGHCTIAGKYVPNKKLSHIQRNIIRVDNSVNAVKEFFYQTRIIYAYDIKELVDYTRTNINEYDQILNLVGTDFILEKVNNDGAVEPIVVDNTYKNKTFTDYTLSRKMTFAGDKTLTDVPNLISYGAVRPQNFPALVVDGNSQFGDNAELLDYINFNLTIDANLFTNPADVVNTNL